MGVWGRRWGVVSSVRPMRKPSLTGKYPINPRDRAETLEIELRGTTDVLG